MSAHATGRSDSPKENGDDVFSFEILRKYSNAHGLHRESCDLDIEFATLASPLLDGDHDAQRRFVVAFARKHGPLGLPKRQVRTQRLLEEGESLSDWVAEARLVKEALDESRAVLERDASSAPVGVKVRRAGKKVQLLVNEGLARSGVVPAVRLASATGVRLVWGIRATTNLQAIWKRVGERAAGVLRFDICEGCGAVMLKSGTRGGTSRRSDAVTCSAKCKMRWWRERRRAARR